MNIRTRGYIMLILTRHPGESLKIGDGVTVTVLGVRHGQVRLGFAAPRDVAVHRQEIYERLRAARPRASGRTAPEALHMGQEESTV